MLTRLYLIKLFDVLIIMLLANNLTNICFKVSEILKVEKMGRQCMYFALLTKVIRDEPLSKTIPLIGRNINSSATIQELPQEPPISGKRKRKLLLEIEKKERKKTKKFSKTTRVDDPDL